jgi:hypothetical protein
MTRSPKSSFLDEQLTLLLRHFGAAKTRAAFERALKNNPELSNELLLAVVRNGRAKFRSDVVTLAELEKTDKAKYRLLSKFKADLNERKVLRESQDIYQFAQSIGLKGIKGWVRRDMISPLIDYLITLPLERLRPELKSATTISEDVRQQGFSLLTDKLLRDG